MAPAPSVDSFVTADFEPPVASAPPTAESVAGKGTGKNSDLKRTDISDAIASELTAGVALRGAGRSFAAISRPIQEGASGGGQPATASFERDQRDYRASRGEIDSPKTVDPIVHSRRNDGGDQISAGDLSGLGDTWASPQIARTRAASSVGAGPQAGEGIETTLPQHLPVSGGSQVTAASQSSSTVTIYKVASRTNPSKSNGSATLGSGEPPELLGNEENGVVEQVIIEIKDEDLRTVLDLLAKQGNMNLLLSKSVQGTVTASLRGVDVPTALDAILKATGYVARQQAGYLLIGTPEELESLAQVGQPVGLRVYRPNYVPAKELQTLVQPLLTPQLGVTTVSSPAEIGIATDSTRAGGNNYAGSEILVVRDYESVLTQIDRLVAEVDVRPLQVAIEAMILSVRLDDSDSLGVNFELFRNRSHLKFGWEFPPSSLTDIRFNGGLKVGFLDGSVGAFVSALQEVRDTNVIAAPRLLVLNKHRAEIQIGKEQGYVSTTFTETASSQSVEFLDTGTLLRIRPFVSSDGMIRMEVHPELSDGEVRELAGFTLPQKDITQVTTNVLVRDGSTVVIGGLIREQLVRGGTQIPLLGDLPYVGFLFRNRKDETVREEIIVLLTPRLVYDEESAAEGALAAASFQQRHAVLADKMNPLGKRHVARRFLRLAENAWRTGDLRRALRFAELAVHFDPSNTEAIALRNQIWHNLYPGAVAPAVPLSPEELLDSGALEPWLWQELAQPLDTPVSGEQASRERRKPQNPWVSGPQTAGPVGSAFGSPTMSASQTVSGIRNPVFATETAGGRPLECIGR